MLWRAALIYAIFAIVMAGLVLMVDLALNGWAGWSTVSVTLAVGAVFFVARTFTAPWWWIKAGRTRYVVADGVLTTWKGDRLLDEIRCEEIFYVEHVGRIDTQAVLLNGFGVPDFPRAVFKGSRDVSGPPLLLWQDADPNLYQLAGLIQIHVDDRKRRLAP